MCCAWAIALGVRCVAVDLGIGGLGVLSVWVGLRSHPDVISLVVFFFLACGGRDVDVVVEGVVGGGEGDDECLRASLRGGVVLVGDGVSVDSGVVSVVVCCDVGVL